MTRINDAVESLRERLFDFAGIPVSVERAGTALFDSVISVQGRSKYEDADRSGAVVFVDATDFLFSGELEYVPRAGDVITCAEGEFVVKPIGSELWKWDDPGEKIFRVHAQRRS